MRGSSDQLIRSDYPSMFDPPSQRHKPTDNRSSHQTQPETFNLHTEHIVHPPLERLEGSLTTAHSSALQSSDKGSSHYEIAIQIARELGETEKISRSQLVRIVKLLGKTEALELLEQTKRQSRQEAEEQEK